VKEKPERICFEADIRINFPDKRRQKHTQWTRQLVEDKGYANITSATFLPKRSIHKHIQRPNCFRAAFPFPLQSKINWRQVGQRAHDFLLYAIHSVIWTAGGRGSRRGRVTRYRKGSALTSRYADDWVQWRLGTRVCHLEALTTWPSS
jgi:hypothetical protein